MSCMFDVREVEEWLGTGVHTVELHDRTIRCTRDTSLVPVTRFKETRYMQLLTTGVGKVHVFNVDVDDMESFKVYDIRKVDGRDFL